MNLNAVEKIMREIKSETSTILDVSESACQALASAALAKQSQFPALFSSDSGGTPSLRKVIEIPGNPEQALTEKKDEYPYLFSIIDSICALKGVTYTPQGTIKESGQKLTRFLRKAISDNSIFDNNISFKNLFSSIFHWYPLEEAVNLFINRELPRIGEIFSEIRAQKHMVLLSVHPADFVLASETGHFTSCYAADGCHFGGTTAYAQDNQTLIAFYLQDKAQDKAGEGESPVRQRVGRVFYHIDKRPILIQSCPYGYFPNNALKGTREYIERTLWPTAKNWKSRTLRLDDFELIYDRLNDDYPGYLDINNKPSSCRIARPEGFRGEILKLELYPAICISCGEETGEPSGICEYCATSCVWCGNSAGPDRHYLRSEDGYLCQRCQALFVECINCGEEIHIEAAYYFEEERYCSECYHDLFEFCDGCGRVCPDEDGLDTDEGWRCASCLGDLGFQECTLCGARSRDTNTYIDEDEEERIICDACAIYSGNFRDVIKRAQCGLYMHIDTFAIYCDGCDSCDDCSFANVA